MGSYKSELDHKHQRYNHKALPPMSRFAIGTISQVAPTLNGDKSGKDAESASSFTLGKVRVDFMFGFGKRVRSGWLPYIKRWSRRREASRELGELDENNKSPQYVGSGMSDVPRIGTRVLVAFIANAYDDGIVLGCIPDRCNSLPIQWQYEDFKTYDIAHTGPMVGLGLVQHGKDETKKEGEEEKGEQLFVFNNELEVKKKEGDENKPYLIKFNAGDPDGEGKNTSSLILKCNNFTMVVDENMTIESEGKDGIDMEAGSEERELKKKDEKKDEKKEEPKKEPEKKEDKPESKEPEKKEEEVPSHIEEAYNKTKQQEELVGTGSDNIQGRTNLNGEVIAVDKDGGAVNLDKPDKETADTQQAILDSMDSEKKAESKSEEDVKQTDQNGSGKKDRPKSATYEHPKSDSNKPNQNNVEEEVNSDENPEWANEGQVVQDVKYDEEGREVTKTVKVTETTTTKKTKNGKTNVRKTKKESIYDGNDGQLIDEMNESFSESFDDEGNNGGNKSGKSGNTGTGKSGTANKTGNTGAGKSNSTANKAGNGKKNDSTGKSSEKFEQNPVIKQQREKTDMKNAEKLTDGLYIRKNVNGDGILTDEKGGAVDLNKSEKVGSNEINMQQGMLDSIQEKNKKK